MNLKFPAGLRDATRLVRGGKLMEATAAIQRALRGDVPARRHAPAMDSDVIEGSCRVIDTRAPTGRRGEFLSRRYTNAAGTREYKVYVPGTRSGEPLPLVVMLHGCKQDADEFAAATRMNALAEEHSFIVVYPQQAGRANGSNCWNWFSPTHQQRDRGEPSLIAGITREVLVAYGADVHRVYVAGLSAGGAMAAIMGATYPDLFAAVGIHSGVVYSEAHDVASAFAAMRGERHGTRNSAAAGRRVPTILFHGDDDKTVHPSNGDELIARSSAAYEHTSERGNARGRSYTKTTHRDALGRTVLEQWVVHGAAHAWSGGSEQGSYSDPRGPDASREMLRFFLMHHNAQ
jgi:poly(hydroxyalkanoate) depolymerase family esterase